MKTLLVYMDPDALPLAQLTQMQALVPQMRALAIFIDNLRRYASGAPLRNVVDKALGY